MKARLITAEELADISDEWENPTVDTSKYYQTALRVLEVDEAIYKAHKAEGGLCQVHEGRFYIA